MAPVYDLFNGYVDKIKTRFKLNKQTTDLRIEEANNQSQNHMNPINPSNNQIYIDIDQHQINNLNIHPGVNNQNHVQNVTINKNFGIQSSDENINNNYQYNRAPNAG